MATAGPWQRRPRPAASPRAPGVPSQGRAPGPPCLPGSPMFPPGPGSPMPPRVPYVPPRRAGSVPPGPRRQQASPAGPPKASRPKPSAGLPPPTGTAAAPAVAACVEPSPPTPRLSPQGGRRGCSRAAVSLGPPEPADSMEVKRSGKNLWHNEQLGEFNRCVSWTSCLWGSLIPPAASPVWTAYRHPLLNGGSSAPAEQHRTSIRTCLSFPAQLSVLSSHCTPLLKMFFSL